MSVIVIVGLVGAGIYAAGLAALVVAIAKTPPISQSARLSPADEVFLADLAAHLKAYGDTVADYYDTEGTP